MAGRRLDSGDDEDGLEGFPLAGAENRGIRKSLAC
jgi:hypothetical protein